MRKEEDLPRNDLKLSETQFEARYLLYHNIIIIIFDM